MIDTPATSRMPVAFVGHGAPLLALDPVKGKQLRAWGEAMATRVGKPRAIVVISAHWEATPLTIGATSPLPLIYDFYGFPRPLYQLEYASPGAPELAERIAGLLDAPVGRAPERGLDHGVWVPLLHLAPQADVPVLQISLPSRLGAASLIELGRTLAPLRDEGVLLLGSGNVVHNLRKVDPSERQATPSWASEFDAWTAEVLAAGDLDALTNYRERAPALRMAHPTEEHWLPLLLVAGAGFEGGGEVRFPITGFEYGSIARRCVEIG